MEERVDPCKGGPGIFADGSPVPVQDIKKKGAVPKNRA
jgi:hypothetical protein